MARRLPSALPRRLAVSESAALETARSLPRERSVPAETRGEPLTVPAAPSWSLAAGASVAIAACLLACLWLEPQWPRTLLSSLAWFGGAWRWSALPLAAAACAAALVANARRPGRAASWVRAAAARARCWAPGGAAALIGLSYVGYSAGQLTLGGAGYGALLLALQVALAPQTPAAALLALVTAAVLVADAGQAHVLAATWRWWMARRRTVERAAQAHGPAALVCARAGPVFAGFAFTHGDPFYPGTTGATVNYTLEFTPSWTTGTRISPLQYFFGEHTVPQFAQYSIAGFRHIFQDVLFEGQPRLRALPVGLWLFLAGTALLLLRRRWVIPFAVLISLAPFYAFLAGVPNPWVFPGRYAHHVLPFAMMAAAYGLWGGPLWLEQVWRNGRSRRP